MLERESTMSDEDRDYSQDPRFGSYVELDKHLLVRKILRLEDTLNEAIRKMTEQVKVIKSTSDPKRLIPVQRMLLNTKFEDKVVVRLNDRVFCGVIRAWDNNSLGITIMYTYQPSKRTVDIPVLSMKNQSTFGISFAHISFKDMLSIRRINDILAQDPKFVLMTAVADHNGIMIEDIPKVFRAWHYGEELDGNNPRIKMINDMNFLIERLEDLRSTGDIIINYEKDVGKSTCAIV